MMCPADEASLTQRLRRNTKTDADDSGSYGQYSYNRYSLDTVSYTHLVDDDRMKLRPGEKIQMKSVRFRTLGCYPLTGGVESTADTLDEIIDCLLYTSRCV